MRAPGAQARVRRQNAKGRIAVSAAGRCAARGATGRAFPSFYNLSIPNSLLVATIVVREGFARRSRADCPDAVAILERDWDALTTFYDFPQEHWKHIRTTNVVESPFAALRLRTGAAKRFKVVANATMFIWRVLRVRESRFRRLDAPELLADVYGGRRFADGKPIARASGKVA